MDYEALQGFFREQLNGVSLRGRCEEISEAAAQEFGLKVVKGWFNLDKPIEHGLFVEPHTWNEDELGNIVDFTAHQFNGGLRFPIKPKVRIVTPQESFFERYKRVGETETIYDLAYR